MHYAITALWTAAQHKIPLTIVVASNAEYGVLKQFGAIEKTGGCRGWTCPASISRPPPPATAYPPIKPAAPTTLPSWSARDRRPRQSHPDQRPGPKVKVPVP
jgi:hypothetical protein